MTDDQMAIALALGRVSPGSGSRSVAYALQRFLHMAEAEAVGESHEFTILQEEYLYLLAIKFRRQVPGAIETGARRLLKLIGPLVRQERDRMRQEAEDRAAVKMAMNRAKQRQISLDLRAKGFT